ncbi:hypothetical protein [Chryseobacterium sp. Leaf394]|uniref:hypothetical protein n=1 Tax=Chryseobacterium sp. Leaf394 TaxID=1736361 RepID=UPI000A455EC0|nr:hypothetical protein [Chryseobacterium sp. Leaf394]
MMKKSYVLLLIFIISLPVCAQKILVRGIAKDTTKGRSSMTISINDTIWRYQAIPAHVKEKLGNFDSSAYSTNTDKLGNYEIEARPSDTLYFRKMHYVPQKHSVSDIVKNNIVVQLVPEPCEMFDFCTLQPALDYLIFKGKKISVQYKVDPYYCNTRSLNYGSYECVYEVTEKIYGYFPGDIIKFNAYDHYGAPVFTKEKSAIVVLGNHYGKLRHHPCTFPNITKTAGGKWACAGNPIDSAECADISLKSKPMNFPRTASVDISDFQRSVLEKFQQPYYRIDGHQAVPLQGIYLEEMVAEKIRLNRISRENLN